MKMNFGKRFVLFVHWLMSLTICGLVVAMLVWPVCYDTTKRLLDDPAKVFYAVALLVIYLLFMVGVIAITFGSARKDGDHGFITVDSSENGRTRIAVVAVEQMIRQAVRGVSGIADMKASINNDVDSISIDVDAVILNGTHVPTVTASIQRSIRSYIELNCGVTVKGVSVSVHSLTDAEQTGRRSRRKASAAVSVEPVYTPPMSAPLPEVEEPAVPAFVAEEPAAVEPETVSEESAQSEPEEAAPKKSFFKGIFGKRGASKEEAAPAFEAEPEEPVAEETDEPEEEPAIEEPVPVDDEPIVLKLSVDDEEVSDEGETEE